MSGNLERALPLRLIALFKFSKATLLVAVGLASLHLLHPGIGAQAQRWLAALATHSDRRAVQQLVSLVSGLSPRGLEVLSAGAFLYAGVFVIEGVGLWLARRWAEYLTVTASLLFVPLEVFELIRRVSAPRLAALTLNLAVAAYLIFRLRQARAAVRASDGPAGVSTAPEEPLE